MDNSIKERLFVAVASHCANEGRAWTLVDIVLAELAGELRDAELARIYRAERDRKETFSNNLLEALTAIHMLAAPSDVEVNGKIYAFKPDPAIYLEAWREMSKRIREIPKAIDEARGCAAYDWNHWPCRGGDMSAYCGHDPQEPDCLQCLHAVNATLRQRAERAEQDARFAAEALLLHNKDALPMATRMVEMEQSLASAQSTIADLQATVERLRGAYEAACGYINECPCDPDIYPEQWEAWKKHIAASAALGDAS